MRPRVAFATYGRAPALAPDDRLLLPALDALGISGEPMIWSSRASMWTAFDAVVLRSCWDYHLHSDAFHHWLDGLERDGVVVWNSPSLVRWNANKRYLIDLARRGVPTIETVIVPRGRVEDVERIVADAGWTRFVIKPAVSASGFETYALSADLDETGRAAIERVVASGDALVQPFADEITAAGELSFVFFEETYSHATLKLASPGEFRVQTEHGGSLNPASPDERLIEQASRVIASLDEKPLYARVDGIVRDDAFIVMELELIEPNLFFELAPGSADRMARAIARRLDSRTSG